VTGWRVERRTEEKKKEEKNEEDEEMIEDGRSSSSVDAVNSRCASFVRRWTFDVGRSMFSVVLKFSVISSFVHSLFNQTAHHRARLA
jgi:hypothetical protein